jgi:hypothetical protein
MSAADISQRLADVRFTPKADIAELGLSLKFAKLTGVSPRATVQAVACFALADFAGLLGFAGTTGPSTALSASRSAALARKTPSSARAWLSHAWQSSSPQFSMMLMASAISACSLVRMFDPFESRLGVVALRKKLRAT